MEKTPKLQIACNTPVAEGMVVHTKSEKAEDGRRAVLEFLLANHPLDCPVCDQSGECELQNFYMNFGLYDPRFREQKVKKKKAVAVGPHVMLDQERCILCSRCVRFTDEITKTGEFGIFNRGDRAELGLYPGQELNNPYSGNVIDICPVGALTEQDFRFKARVWYLSSAPSVCNGCAQGCNIDVHYVLDRPHLNDGARVLRLKPRYNPDVNQWWMCDEGRFGFRLDRPRTPDARSAIAAPSRPGSRPSPPSARRWRRLRDSGELARGSASSPPRSSPTRSCSSSGSLSARLGRQRDGCRSGAARLQRRLPHQGRQESQHAWRDRAGTGRPGRADRRQHRRRRACRDASRRCGSSGTTWRRSSATQSSRRCRARSISSSSRARTRIAPLRRPTGSCRPPRTSRRTGRFVNCHGRVQRIGRAFPPLAGSREDWALLLDIARRLDHPLAWRTPQEIFLALAKTVAAFAGLSYEAIGSQGARDDAANRCADAAP